MGHSGSQVLHASHDAKQINHSIAFSDDGACTDQAESYFSRLRRAEIGVHHRIGIHLGQYAAEMAWREDHRRKPNGAQYVMCAAAALGPPVGRVLAAGTRMDACGPESTAFALTAPF